MPKEINPQRASDKLRRLARYQTFTALLILFSGLLFFLFLALNALIKLSEGCGWATIAFGTAFVVLVFVFFSLKSTQLTTESELFRQRLVRKPRGVRETLWRLFMPGQWMRNLQVDRPHAEIEMSPLPDLERPLPVSTRARY